MKKLAPGTLLKLLDGMNTGSTELIRFRRSSLLQITDILPVNLDGKDLVPRHGFYIKVSDSYHSIYVALPLDQYELILCDKMQLGQFIYVDRLEPGSPVPVVKGVNPLPGRQPLVGTPEPIIQVVESGARSTTAHQRGSWELDQNLSTSRFSLPIIAKQTTWDSKESTVNERSGVKGSTRATSRRSMGEAFQSKIANLKEERFTVRKSCLSDKLSRNKTAREGDSRIPTSPFSIEKSYSTTPSSRLRNVGTGDSSPASNERRRLNKPHQLRSIPPFKYDSNRMSLPGNLSGLGKEVVQKREAAQKVALQALRDASAAESLVRALKMFSKLSATARPDDPAACFNMFLSFHQEITQVVIDMETIQAATPSYRMESCTSRANTLKPDLGMSLRWNVNQMACSNIAGPETEGIDENEAHTSTSKVSMNMGSKWNVNQMGCSYIEGPDVDVNDENKAETCSLASSMRLAKQIETEAGYWFMDFLEAALEAGLKITRGSMVGDEKKLGCCPESLLLKVIYWVEVEHSDSSSKRPFHYTATHIARRLKMKVRNR